MSRSSTMIESHRWQVCVLGLVLCAALLMPAVMLASSFPLRMGRIRSTLEFDFNSSREHNSIGTSVGLDFDRYRFREKLNLRNNAHIFDRRFISLDSQVSLGLFQNRLAISEQQYPTDGRVLDYGFGATVLSAKRLSLRFFANRSESTVSRRFVGTSDVMTHNRGVTIDLKRTVLPSTLTLRREGLDQKTQSGLLIGRRQENRSQVVYDGRKTWDSQNLLLRYERFEVNDKIAEEQSYDTRTAAISHRIRFWDRQPITLRTRLRKLDRDGRRNLSTLTWDESLSIENTDRLSTAVQFTLSRFKSAGEITNSKMAVISGNHQLYSNLSTDVNARWSRVDLATGKQLSNGFRLNFRYTKRLPRGGRLNARTGSRYEHRDNPSQFVEMLVVGESHTIDVGLPFRLQRPDAIAASLTITNVQRSTVFEEGVDYMLRSIGAFLEIEVVLTGRIEDQQAVLVDYRVREMSSSEFSTRSAFVNIGIDYPWFSPYMSYDRANQELLSGDDDGAIDDTFSRIVGVKLRGKAAGVNGTVVVEHANEDSRRLAFVEWRLTQSLSYVRGVRFSATMNIREIFSSFRIPDRRTQRVIGRLNTSMRLARRLTVDSFVAARLWDDTVAPDESFSEAGLRARWSFALSEFQGAIERRTQTRETTKARQVYTSFKLVRSF